MVWEERHLGCGRWTMPAKVDYPSVSGVWISFVRSVNVNQVFTNMNIPVDIPALKTTFPECLSLCSFPHYTHQAPRQTNLYFIDRPLRVMYLLRLRTHPSKDSNSLFFLLWQARTFTNTHLHILGGACGYYADSKKSFKYNFKMNTPPKGPSQNPSLKNNTSKGCLKPGNDGWADVVGHSFNSVDARVLF